MYLEVLLIAQYTFQIPTRLRCPFVTPELRETAEFIGLHGSAVRCLPIFVLYLATLMHTYVLARWQVRVFVATRRWLLGVVQLAAQRSSRPHGVAVCQSWSAASRACGLSNAYVRF